MDGPESKRPAVSARDGYERAVVAAIVVVSAAIVAGLVIAGVSFRVGGSAAFVIGGLVIGVRKPLAARLRRVFGGH